MPVLQIRKTNAFSTKPWIMWNTSSRHSSFHQFQLCALKCGLIFLNDVSWQDFTIFANTMMLSINIVSRHHSTRFSWKWKWMYSTETYNNFSLPIAKTQIVIFLVLGNFNSNLYLTPRNFTGNENPHGAYIENDTKLLTMVCWNVFLYAKWQSLRKINLKNKHTYNDADNDARKDRHQPMRLFGWSTNIVSDGYSHCYCCCCYLIDIKKKKLRTQFITCNNVT